MDKTKIIQNEMIKMEHEFYGMTIPKYMRNPLAEYVINHKSVGGFLKALLSNNLFETYEYADDNNIRNIPAYLNYLYNHAPSGCWGSLENYQAWIKGH